MLERIIGGLNQGVPTTPYCIEGMRQEDIYVEASTIRDDYNPGINVQNGNGNSTLSTDLNPNPPLGNHVLDVFANIQVNLSDSAGAQNEFCQDALGLGTVAGYPSVLSVNPLVMITARDARHLNAIDNFRYVEATHTINHTLNDLEYFECSAGVQRNSWGASILTILSVSPNPFNPSAEVSFELRSSGPVNMEIYDISGRRVRTVELGILNSGLHRTRWDGRDMNGRAVSSGIYLVRLRSARGESQPVKVVLMR